MRDSIYVSDYDYNLPTGRIASQPLAQRDASKLLIYQNGQLKTDTFSHLADYIAQKSLLVLNNTRVIEARLLFEKPTGGRIEIFCLEPYDTAMEQAMQQTGAARWHCLIGGASKWSPGQVLKKDITINGTQTTLEACYIQKEQSSFIIEFRWAGAYAFSLVLQAAGAVPLPPYIKRKATGEDGERYQTVFAEHKGSVAAPTAALHITHRVLKKLEARQIQLRYLTLHVGAGTFKPVQAETIAEHPMHAESFTVSMGFLKSLLEGRTITVVGTTSLRTLESLHWLGVKLMQHGVLKKFELAQWEAYDLDDKITYAESLGALVRYLETTGQNELHCRTSLLIVPGYRFKSATALVTNFHQPRSTLLLLVAAFIGADWKAIYEYALQHDFRFLSYGDSSLLFRHHAEA